MRWRYLVGLAVLAFAALTLALRQPGAAPRVAAPSGSPPAPSGPPAVQPLTLPPQPRVLVFAPHPDDETVGVGGLIVRLARARVPLRVVFVTNGDGYPRAVEQDFDVKKPTDDDYVAFGELRQREALAALARLGVGRRDVRFLGFPDGGLAELWRAHWLRSRPYTSPYTKEDSPPYPDSEKPGVEYDGQDLTAVISGVLREFHPSVVVMPHPYDSHLDHAHTSYFVTEAMTDLQERGVLPASLTVLTYVVHYPAWPATRGPGFDRFLPLDDLRDTTWTDVDLAPAELAAKRAALAEYKSQLEVMGGFLRRFLCRNELYGTIDRNLLARIASVH